jgi:hypothetical protein
MVYKQSTSTQLYKTCIRVEFEALLKFVNDYALASTVLRHVYL